MDVAGVAERVDCLPVFVERSLSLSARVHQVIGELLELDVGTALQRLGRGVLAVPAHDLCPVAFVERGVVPERELVAVGRHQPLEGLAHEEELEVALEPVVDIGDAILVEGLEVGGDVGLVGRNLHWVAVLAPTAQHHHDPLPVGAGHLGHVAVDELMLLVHH